jgi:hypothetical protein
MNGTTTGTGPVGPGTGDRPNRRHRVMAPTGLGQIRLKRHEVVDGLINE